MTTQRTSRCFWLGAPRTAVFAIVLAASVLCAALVSPTHAQNRDSQLWYTPAKKGVLYPEPKSPVRLTYGGRAYLSFPNYDVFLFRAPRTLAEATTEEGNPPANANFPASVVPAASVIMKNEQGMRWDGANFFLHPAYPYQIVTRFRYTRNIVGEPRETRWPDETLKTKDRGRTSAPFTGMAQLPPAEFGRYAVRDVPRYHPFPIPQLRTEPMMLPEKPADESTEYSSTARNSIESAHGGDERHEVKPSQKAAAQPAIKPGVLAHGNLDRWNVKTLKSDRPQ